MYIAQVLHDFNSKVEMHLFPFMGRLGFADYYHSMDDQSRAFSSYEFKKGDDFIIIYLGLNRLDYNSGIQVEFCNLGQTRKTIQEVLNRTDSTIQYGYSKNQLDQSMERIKADLGEALRTVV